MNGVDRDAILGRINKNKTDTIRIPRRSEHQDVNPHYIISRAVVDAVNVDGTYNVQILVGRSDTAGQLVRNAIVLPGQTYDVGDYVCVVRSQQGAPPFIISSGGTSTVVDTAQQHSHRGFYDYGWLGTLVAGL